MANFISTETTVLLSFLCRKKPNLFKYIVRYSTPAGKKPAEPSKITALSAQQIQEAREHPNGIIFYTLRTIATIQKALNTVTDKLDELAKQRSSVENALAALIALEAKEKHGNNE